MPEDNGRYCTEQFIVVAAEEEVHSHFQNRSQWQTPAIMLESREGWHENYFRVYNAMFVARTPTI